LRTWLTAYTDLHAMVTASKHGILQRALANAGKLLGGKTAAGIMQLATFALAARGLGKVEFGVFSVVTAQAMVFTGLATFESNQAIIRYGVPHLEHGDNRAIQALFKAGTILDIGAAIIAAVAIVLTAPLLGHWLGWTDDLVGFAQAMAPLPLANAIGTPKGMLRLFGRFDLLSVHVVVTPLVRLALIGVLALFGMSLGWYVGAWVVAGIAGAAVAVFLAWREANRRSLLALMDKRMRGLSVNNPGLWRFSLFSNLNSSLALIPGQLATVLVAGILGESAAGLFRVAREIGTGLLKPVDLVNQAIYPDMARLIASENWRELRQTAIRAGGLAGFVGAGLTLVAWMAGPGLIALTFGPEFKAATPVLIAIAGATSLRVLAFAADPIMYALGRPDTPFAITAFTSLLFVGILVWRLRIDGLAGAGWAFLGMSAVAAVLSTIAARRAVLIRSEI